MNKAESVKLIADKAGASQKQTIDIINAYHETIIEAVAGGDTVTYVGFGAYLPIHKKARTGRNPQTGEAIEIPEAYVPKFRPGKEFKDAVARR